MNSINKLYGLLVAAALSNFSAMGVELTVSDLPGKIIGQVAYGSKMQGSLITGNYGNGIVYKYSSSYYILGAFGINYKTDYLSTTYSTSKKNYYYYALSNNSGNIKVTDLSSAVYPLNSSTGLGYNINSLSDYPSLTLSTGVEYYRYQKGSSLVGTRGNVDSDWLCTFDFSPAYVGLNDGVTSKTEAWSGCTNYQIYDKFTYYVYTGNATETLYPSADYTGSLPTNIRMCIVNDHTATDDPKAAAGFEKHNLEIFNWGRTGWTSSYATPESGKMPTNDDLHLRGYVYGVIDFDKGTVVVPRQEVGAWQYWTPKTYAQSSSARTSYSKRETFVESNYSTTYYIWTVNPNNNTWTNSSSVANLRFWKVGEEGHVHYPVYLTGTDRADGEIHGTVSTSGAPTHDTGKLPWTAQDGGTRTTSEKIGLSFKGSPWKIYLPASDYETLPDNAPTFASYKGGSEIAITNFDVTLKLDLDVERYNIDATDGLYMKGTMTATNSERHVKSYELMLVPGKFTKAANTANFQDAAKGHVNAFAIDLGAHSVDWEWDENGDRLREAPLKAVAASEGDSEPQTEIAAGSMTYPFNIYMTPDDIQSFNPSTGYTLFVKANYKESTGLTPTFHALSVIGSSGQVTGVDNVAIDEDATESLPRYFNLQGIEVRNPQPGQLLIEQTANGSRKILYR